jgi:hypothetical protein
MVALIHPPTSVRPSSARPPELRLVRGSLADPPVDRTPLAVLGGLVLVIALVVGIRVAQGAPANSVDGPAVVVAAASTDEATQIVQSGDTLWTIAERLAPGRDPRPIVDALADRNGGTDLWVGQLLVIPGDLAGAPSELPLAADAAGSSS